MPDIHPTAVIEDGAKIGTNVKVGAYSIVGANVELGENTQLHSHVVVVGHTKIGTNCQIYPFASIGQPPQDLKYKGERNSLSIGNETVIREYVTINPGTEGGGLKTQVGNKCLLMVGTHVGHDCTVGDEVIFANNATLGGHVIVEDFAIFGGLSAVIQHRRIGKLAIIGGLTVVDLDVIPYGRVVGNRAILDGLNLIGLKRRNYPHDQIQELRNAYNHLFADKGTLQDRIQHIEHEFPNQSLVNDVIKFLKVDTNNGICLPENLKSRVE